MKNEDFYLQLLNNIYDGVYFIDMHRKITFWNKGAERITGYSAAEVLGRFCFDNILKHINKKGDTMCAHSCPLYFTLEDGDSRDLSIFLHHKQGHRIPVSIRSIAIREDGKIIGAVEVFKDDTERNEILKDLNDLKVQALRDQLTGLPNRRYMDSFLASRAGEYGRTELPFGLLFIDIDHFKKFNDTYGHDAGDRVLQIVSKTLSSNVRGTDIVARWGGEEFVAFIDCHDAETLAQSAERLRMLVENSYRLDGDQPLQVTVSIGATLYRAGEPIEETIRRADKLLYQSKANGRNMVTVG